MALFPFSRRGFEKSVVLSGRMLDRLEVDVTPYLRPLLAVLDEARTATPS